MNKTYFIITFQVNGTAYYFAPAKVTMYKCYTDDIFIASRYEQLKDAKAQVTNLKNEDKYCTTHRSDYHIVEYTFTAAAGQVIV